MNSDMGSKLGLCLCYCENGRRSPARAGCCAINSGIRTDMAGGKMSMLGSIVSFWHIAWLSYLA